MATELGQAYVQIMPSAKGISGSISKVLDPEAKSAGKSAGSGIGSSIVSTIGKVLAAAGVGTIIKNAITGGGELEQAVGGVETLFKDSAGKVIGYANDAYKTAGVSANDYMSNVTSFSASLLQSLGGDTEKAAEAANTAMIDMSDNANKFGSDMGSIQMAYQGFAKQNYTMLDNLKLGYGGTKTEMERLLKDATELSGVKYDISNLSDVYEAIHVIQTEMGVTGTTMKEAESTFTGSLQMMKASWENLTATMATGGDWDYAFQGLTSSIVTFAGNLFPMLSDVLKDLPLMLATLIRDVGPPLISSALEMLASVASTLGARLPEIFGRTIEGILGMIQSIADNIPALMQAATAILTGLANSITRVLPILTEQVPVILQAIIDNILANLPMMVQAGIDLFTALVLAIPEIIMVVVAAIPLIIDGILTAIVENLPTIIEAGIELFTALIEDLPTIIKTVVAALPKIIDGITKTIGTLIPMIVDAGVQLLTALVENLPEIISTIVAVLPTIVSSIVTALLGNLPTIIDAGVTLLIALVENLPLIISTIVDALPQIIEAIMNALLDNIPLFVDAGVSLLTALIINLPEIIVALVKAMPGIITGMVNALAKGITSFVKIGGDLLSGIWNGIRDKTSWLWNKVKGVLSGLTDKIKNFFGIGSPSKLMKKDIGRWLPAGVAEGITDNMKPVSRAMDELGALTTRSFESNLAFDATVSGSRSGSLSGSGGDLGLSSGWTSGQPLKLRLVLGGHEFEAFVDDISLAQDRSVALQLAY